MGLTRIRVPEQCQPKLYKQDQALPPGTYLYYSGQLPKRQCKALGGVACSMGGRFRWIFPDAIYVRRHLTGYLPPELAVHGTEKTLDPRLWGDLCDLTFRPWQLDTLLNFQAFFRHRLPFRQGIIAGMGSGKTLLGLALASRFKRPAVLAPRYLFSEWAGEGKKWGLACPTLSTYASCGKLDFTPDLLIIDESNAASNPCAQTRRIRDLAARSACCIGYTGTSISVAPMQIRWVNAIRDGVYPDTDVAFKHLYGLDLQLKEVFKGCEEEGISGRSVWDVTEWDLDRIAADGAGYLAVPDVSALYDGLAEIDYRVIHTRKPKFYDMLLAGAASTSGPKARAQALMGGDGFIVHENGVVQDIGGNKIQILKDLIDRIGEPVMVVAHWVPTMDRLKTEMASYHPAVVGEGNDIVEKARFLNGDTNVFLCPAEKVKGHNIHERCRIAIVLSNSASPLMRRQLVFRIFRPGQTKQSIIIDLCAEGTLDEPRLKALQEHANTSEDVERAVNQAWERLLKKG